LNLREDLTNLDPKTIETINEINRQIKDNREVRYEDEFAKLTDEQKKALLELCRKQQPANPDWFTDGRVNEMKFADFLLSERPMVCVNDSLYRPDGTPVDTGLLSADILSILSPYVSADVPRRIRRIIDTVKLRCRQPVPGPDHRYIHVENGTVDLKALSVSETHGRNCGHVFTSKKSFTLNRLPVAYNASAPSPERWLGFVSTLLEPEDIPTLQEFMGYCLIPTNKGQKMLLILGSGGEGKSRIGIVLKSILGDSMITGSISKIETDRFARANLVGRLVFFDDDMPMEALEETHTLKSIITLEGSTDIEIKGKQSFQAALYSRILAVGNGSLSALHDRSDGFFRRQIILTTKPKDPGRIDDPFLAEKLVSEKEGIFLWCLEGLRRLLDNNYRFTVSQKASDNLKEAMEDSNNIISFMRSDGYVRTDVSACAPGRSIYEAYCLWCHDNCLKPLGERTFSTYLKQNAGTYGLTYSNNIPYGTGGRKVRGYHGINVTVRTSAYTSDT
jgi:putative DNA primase/helicase